jgi:hypothetical protein
LIDVAGVGGGRPQMPGWIAGLHTKVSYLPPATSVAGLPVLMAHDQDLNSVFEISVYN